MSKFASVPTPLEIDDVQSARVAAGETRLTLSGRWLSPNKPSLAEEPLLVIQVEGRRHRFTPEAGTDTGSPTGEWRASFVVPAWAEPRRAGQAAVWVGDAVVSLPPIHAGRGASVGGAPPALAAAVPADAPGAELPEAASPDEFAPAVPALADPPAETPRSGPLADLLLKETVAALHAELEQRGTEAAQLRSALAGAQFELEARGGTQSELESTLGQLGSELRRLMEAVEAQRREIDQRDAQAERERAEFEQRLAELAAARDEQATELASMRDQQAAELAALRDQQAAEQASMRDQQAAELAAARDQQADEVESLREQLADAEARLQRRSAETVGLREELAAATVSRDAARSEVAGLRSELERLGAELAVTREHVQSEAGDLGEANRLLADAKALAEELRPRPETG